MRVGGRFELVQQTVDAKRAGPSGAGRMPRTERRAARSPRASVSTVL